MLYRSVVRHVWLGGTASLGSLGVEVRPAAGQFVNVIPEGTQSRRTAAHFDPTPQQGLIANTFAQPELRRTIAREAVPKPTLQKWQRRLRADVYDELLKLPLRYALHDFRRLQEHLHAYSGEGEGAVMPSPGLYESDAAEAGGAGDETSRFYGVAGRDSAVGYAPPLGPADPLDTIAFFVHRTSNGLLPGKITSMHPRNLMPAFVMRIQNIDGDVFRFEEELIKIFPTKKIFVRSHSVYIYNVNLDGRMVLHHWLLGLGF